MKRSGGFHGEGERAGGEKRDFLGGELEKTKKVVERTTSVKERFPVQGKKGGPKREGGETDLAFLQRGGEGAVMIEGGKVGLAEREGKKQVISIFKEKGNIGVSEERERPLPSFGKKGGVSSKEVFT